MERFVVSCPRSGLNWLRFCIEYFYGQRTPGRPLILPPSGQEACVFRRSHDPLGYTRAARHGVRSWSRFDPARRAGDKSLLILRDPASIFQRAFRKQPARFRAYVSNLRYLTLAAGDKRVAYYEDIVADPAAMWAVLDFLDLPVAPGREAPSADLVARDWAAAGAASRNAYDRNQAAAGGATTRETPTDFRYHARRLTPAEQAFVWDGLARDLTGDEMALLVRYKPDGLPVLNSRARFQLRRSFLAYRLRGRVQRLRGLRPGT
jgi:hypothetical protein